PLTASFEPNRQDRRTGNHVAVIHPHWISCQTVKPLERDVSHPARRTRDPARKEFERSAATDPNSRCIATAQNALRNKLLLGRADTDKRKARRMFSDELRSLSDGLRIAPQTPRRDVMVNAR